MKWAVLAALLLPFLLAGCEREGGGMDAPAPSPGAGIAAGEAGSTVDAVLDGPRPPTPAAGGVETHMALVIGNERYPGSSVLSTPVADARLVAGELTAAGYRVELVENAGRVDMATHIEGFALRSADAAVRVVYFAGHAFEFDSENYLLPTDIGEEITALERDEVRMHGIPLHRIIADLETPESTLVMIVDACRVPPIRGGTETASLGSIDPPSGVMVAFSTSPGATAKDSLRAYGRAIDHSPFAYSLAASLGSVSNQTWDDVLRATYDLVRSQTRNDQTPWFNARVSAFPDVRAPEGDSAASPTAAATAATTEKPRPRERGGEVADLFWREEQSRVTDLTSSARRDDGQALRVLARGGDHGAAVALAGWLDQSRGKAARAEVIELLSEAARDGHAVAQLDLGTLLIRVPGDSVDDKGPEQWWILASANGLHEASAKLSILRMERGEPGASHDAMRAFADYFQQQMSEHNRHIQTQIENAEAETERRRKGGRE